MIYDTYQIKMELTTFINLISKSDLHLRKINEKDLIYFEASFIQRHKISKQLKQAELMKECQLMIFVHHFTQKSMMISLVIALLLWQYLTSFVYEIKIYGNGLNDHSIIQQYLKTLPKSKKSLKTLKQDLQSQLSNELNWLEVIDKGCKYEIHYRIKELVNQEKKHSQKLYAQEDAMIAYFDIVDGKKVVSVNDLVKKGDLLVDDQLSDYQQKTHMITSKGVVYGYTIKEVRIKQKVSKMLLPFAFYQMLLQARNEVSKDFLGNDRICDENILHFSYELDTIKIYVQYRLLKDISTKKS